MDKKYFSNLDRLPLSNIEDLVDTDFLEIKPDGSMIFKGTYYFSRPESSKKRFKIEVDEKDIGKPLANINNNVYLKKQIKIYNSISKKIEENKLTKKALDRLKKQKYIEITDKDEIIVHSESSKLIAKYLPGLILGYIYHDNNNHNNGKIYTSLYNVDKQKYLPRNSFLGRW